MDECKFEVISDGNEWVVRFEPTFILYREFINFLVNRLGYRVHQNATAFSFRSSDPDTGKSAFECFECVREAEFRLKGALFQANVDALNLPPKKTALMCWNDLCCNPVIRSKKWAEKHADFKPCYCSRECASRARVGTHVSYD